LNSNSSVLFELVCFSKKEKERKIIAKERNPANPKPQPGPAQTALENPTQIQQAGPFLSLKPVGRPTLCLLSFLPVRPSKQPSRPASSLPRAWPKRARSAQPSVSALRASPPPSDKAGPLNSVRAPEPAPSLSARVRARPLTGVPHLSAQSSRTPPFPWPRFPPGPTCQPLLAHSLSPLRPTSRRHSPALSFPHSATDRPAHPVSSVPFLPFFLPAPARTELLSSLSCGPPSLGRPTVQLRLRHLLLEAEFRARDHAKSLRDPVSSHQP